MTVCRETLRAISTPEQFDTAMLDTTFGKLAFADRSPPNNHLRVTLILLSIRDRREV